MLEPQLLTKIKVACMHHVALMKDGACGSVRTLDGEHAYFSMEATQHVRLVAFDLSTGKGKARGKGNLGRSGAVLEGHWFESSARGITSTDM